MSKNIIGNLQGAFTLLYNHRFQVNISRETNQVEIRVYDHKSGAMFSQYLPFDHLDTKLGDCILFCINRVKELNHTSSG